MQTSGKTHQVTTPCGKMYITINDVGKKQIFIHIGKAGNCAKAQTEAIARLCKLVYKLGGTNEMLTETLRGISCYKANGRDLSCAEAVCKAINLHGV